MTESTSVPPRPYWLRTLLATLPAFIVVAGATLLLKWAGRTIPLPITQGALLFSFALVLPNPSGAPPRPFRQRLGVATVVGVFVGLANWALEVILIPR